MILIYTTPSCQSCRKALKYLRDKEVPFVEKNIFVSILNIDELKRILEYTEAGFDSIISKRSNAYNNLKLDFDDLTIEEASKIIIENPSILKRPIIIDTSRRNIEIGYSYEGIKIMKRDIKRSIVETIELDFKDIEDYDHDHEHDAKEDMKNIENAKKAADLDSILCGEC